MEMQKEFLTRRGGNLERELDNWAFALQRDLLMWRLARLQGFPAEEKRKRCFEQLRHLRDLLDEIETFLRDRQEGATGGQQELN